MEIVRLFVDLNIFNVVCNELNAKCKFSTTKKNDIIFPREI